MDLFGPDGCAHLPFGKGNHAGFRGAGSRCILLGDNTQTPSPDSDGFVNIDNRLCFWRDTGEIAECPPPYDPSENEEDNDNAVHIP
jgi:hypothetical protein